MLPLIRSDIVHLISNAGERRTQGKTTPRNNSVTQSIYFLKNFFEAFCVAVFFTLTHSSLPQTKTDGIRLTEGYVADEDTTIYNPGLSLLTNSEKERLVSAIISNRKTGLSTNHWSENNEYAFDFLKTKLDPLHMYELEGYLSILPYYGAVLYLGALFVQKNVRGVFPVVYGACAFAVFAPVFVLVASGP